MVRSRRRAVATSALTFGGVLATTVASFAGEAGTALRFYGNGAFEENQVKIRIDAPAVPADIGIGDFTLEFWMKALPGENVSPPCVRGGSNWINGNIVLDRDVFGNGDYGDYGVSLAAGRLAVGVSLTPTAGGYFETTFCGSRVVDDGEWHHVAVSRYAGALWLHVDGLYDGGIRVGVGDYTYRDGRPTSYPNSDPFLVIGAEKHFGATAWSGFSGWIDEVRLSSPARFCQGFPRPTEPFVPDPWTKALYHLDEGAGDFVGDSSGAPGGPSHGVRHFGGSPAGPVWVASDAPLSGFQGVHVAFVSLASTAVESSGTAPYALQWTTSDGAPTTRPNEIALRVRPGTATPVLDYTPLDLGVLSPAGLPSGHVTNLNVPLSHDTLDEDDETLVVDLIPVCGTNGGTPSSHTVTILDDDPLPSLSSGDCAVLEGDAGTTPCTPTVRLGPASGRDVTVGYATVPGTATAGSDFQPVSGTLTFAAGAVEHPVAVPVIGDTAVEPDEGFTLQLGAPTFAVLDDAVGSGTIVDDDAAPLPGIELSHGSVLHADLAGGAPDLYRISQPPFTSFEVVVDEASGDAGLVLERLGSDGTTVLQTASAIGTGTARSLRWANALAAAVTTQYLRVRATGCTVPCAADDTYRLRVLETTGRLSRFNNTGSQITVLLLQNTRSEPIDGHAHFWLASGTLLTSVPFTLDPRGLLKLDTVQTPILQGYSGAVTVTHDGGYAGLAGKAAMLEPATGFSFDAPLTYRER
jgi:hypothetical protein